MQCRIRLQLPDRPGSLGTVTCLLGRLGVDIQQILVLDRDGDRAIDEMIVAVPGDVVLRCLSELLAEIPGVYVLELQSLELQSTELDCESAISWGRERRVSGWPAPPLRAYTPQGALGG
jgi:acetolactate synthase small subunit